MNSEEIDFADIDHKNIIQKQMNFEEKYLDFSDMDHKIEEIVKNPE